LDNWGIDNLLNYSSSFQDHNLNILIGHTIQKESAFTNQINGAVFPSDEVVNFGEAGEILGSNNYYDWSLIAGFGRINYDYKGKYLVEFNFRREGSSRLGANNRFGDFPSGAFGWRVSQENFYPTDFLINEFLISASFGKTGNNSIGNYDALGRLGAIRTVIGNSISEGKFQSSISNNDLKWETAFQYQFGVNLGILDDRITLKTNYFKKITKDMLFNVALPGASGYGSTRINLGEMENNGLEIEIYSVNMPDGNFQWNTNFNVSFLDNKVTHMPEQIDRIISGPLRGTNITTVGEEVGAFYGFVRLGLFDEETIDDPNLYGWQGDQKILGTNIFKDINGDGHIDYEDQIVIGSPHPDIIFGFNNQFTFKNISLSFLATGMLGYDIMRASNGVFYNNAARWNVSKELLNRWKSPEHPGNGQVPRTEYNLGNREGMDDWLEPGDHLWIKNVNLSYSLPDRLLQSIGKINGLRIYFTVKNLARFDKYSGFNPEVSQSGGNPLSIGVDNFVYPISRSYSLGVDLNF
jgi:TonB-linked SusC/RagA family outer membrane protein